MLAYVFWHWPAEGVEQAAYEAAMVGFQTSLNRYKPEGFISSAVLGLARTPWSGKPRPIYEDWYLVKDFASLGLLNDGAVNATNKPPHDGVATRVEGGAGGVYRLKAGAPDFAAMRRAHWFSKPAGLPYAEFYSGVPAGDVVGQWERQMVLGPAPECCIFTDGRQVSVPKAENAIAIDAEPVWVAS
jgi:hypothetical protein